MMGSGKSTIGELLARLTGWPYYDNDEILEHLKGETAKSLLAHEGLTELRDSEGDTLLSALKLPPPCIVGAPAGTILRDELRDHLRGESLVVWLTASPRTLARRARGAAHRPWLGGDAEAWMTKTLAERAPLYESVANYQVSTQRRTPSAVATEIAKWLDGRCE